MITLRDMVKITLNLVAVYVAGGAILAAMYIKTSPVIFRNGVNEKKAALQKIMPEAGRIEKLGDWTIHEKKAEYYAALDGDRMLGYIIESYGKGYSGYIHLLVALDTLFKVEDMSILSHTETPGLGDEIESVWFRKQFRLKDIHRMRVSKTGDNDFIQAISGATISSKGVTEDAVKNAIEFLNAALDRKKVS